MYMLIAIVFIAELIIAYHVISWIIKVDRKICDLNACVRVFNPLAETCMQYVRCVTTTLTNKVKKSIEFIRIQKSKFITKTLITFAIYAGLFLFKLKKIKIRKIGNLVGAIRDIAVDLAV
ncbi:hypothetical protein J6P92_06165 [bacterium]|nr:hypothetical protein [bacterium]